MSIIWLLELDIFGVGNPPVATFERIGQRKGGIEPWDASPLRAIKMRMNQAIPRETAWMQDNPGYGWKRAPSQYGHIELPWNLGDPASFMEDRRTINDRGREQRRDRCFEVRLGRRWLRNQVEVNTCSQPGRSDQVPLLPATQIFAPPLDFDGPGDAWSPEHLAVETCFVFMLRSVARASKVEFISLELSGEGTVDRKDGATRFTEIVLRPRLRLPAGADKGRALRVLEIEKSERACLVSASISTPVRLQPEILAG